MKSKARLIFILKVKISPDNGSKIHLKGQNQLIRANDMLNQKNKLALTNSKIIVKMNRMATKSAIISNLKVKMSEMPATKVNASKGNISHKINIMEEISTKMMEKPAQMMKIKA